MRKIAIITVLGLVGIGVGVAYFYWDQATALPDWYSLSSEPSQNAGQSSPATAVPATSPRSASVITQSIQAAPSGTLQTQLSAAEIDNLIMAGLSQAPPGQQQALPPAVKAVKTQIQQDQIKTGAVVDLDELAQMPPSGRTQQLQKIFQVIPQLQGRQVYVGVSGQLTVKNQQLQLSPDSKVQIGKVEFGLDEAAQRMGVSRTQLERQLTSYLQLPSLTIQQIDLTDRGAVITGTKK